MWVEKQHRTKQEAVAFSCARNAGKIQSTVYEQ